MNERADYHPDVYHRFGEKVDMVGRHPKPAENRHSSPLSTIFSLRTSKEEIERERGKSRDLFDPMVDSRQVVDADLSDAWSTDPMATAQAITTTLMAKRDNTDPEPVRDLYRANRDKALRRLIAEIMTGGK